MLLIEADGKALFSEYGIPVPAGVVTRRAPAALPDSAPWIVKAQVPVGGRGKAGGVVPCASPADIDAVLHRLLGSRLKGHQVDACLIERAVIGEERYLAVMVDAASYGVRVIYSAQGGVNVEQSGSAPGQISAPEMDAIAATVARMVAHEPAAWRDNLTALGRKLARLLLERELMLAEINPLFVSSNGCIAGDAKVVIDLNAIDRQPHLAALLAARPAIYADANRKLREGFDYVELDPAGEIGLVTTGAGLSMMLIDELTARGARPLNFCDIRTGQMRGSPARLMRVLAWITARPSLRAVLVNIFAGITDLAEFADLLATAVERTPALRVPVVARLVGRNAEQAKRILAERQPDMLVTEDLEGAMAAVIGAAQSERPLPLREAGGWRGRAIHPDTAAERTTPPPNPLPQGEGEESRHPSPIPQGEAEQSRHPSPIPQGEAEESRHPSPIPQGEAEQSRHPSPIPQGEAEESRHPSPIPQGEAEEFPAPFPHPPRRGGGVPAPFPHPPRRGGGGPAPFPHPPRRGGAVPAPFPHPARGGGVRCARPPALLPILSSVTPAIVQGITGRMGRTHAALMRAYGTNIVGGTSSRPDATEAAGVPVFATCAEAVAATGAVASVDHGAAAGNPGRRAGGARRRHPGGRHGGGGGSLPRRTAHRPRRSRCRQRCGSAPPPPAWPSQARSSSASCPT